MRSLWRIDENGERIETVEAGVEPVNARIMVELTDLTFDQFRRTALLAQGDFDAFLRADRKERADLLEKITGAEIYARLSNRAYEKARDAREAVELLEGLRREIGGLSEEARAALVAESADIETKRAALVSSRAEIVAALRRLEAQALAQRRLADAQQARALAEQAFAARADDRARLAALVRVEPLRAPRQEAARTQQARSDKDRALALAVERADAARQALESAQAAERLAAEALQDAAQEVARQAPVWAQAGALDARLEAQTREVDAARDEATFAERRAEEEAARLAQARKEQAAAARDGAAARERLERLSPAQPLGERWPEIEDWLDKRTGFSLERATEAELLRKAEEAGARARDMRRALEDADAADRAAQGAALAQIGEREAALAALDAPAAEQRLDACSRRQELLQAMARAARDHAAAQETGARAAQAGAQAAGAAQAGAARLSELQDARARQAPQTDDAERLGELAEAAADREALRLRVTLQAGEACPVCGARDHPFAHGSGAAQALIETLRARRDAARQALARIDAEIARTGAQLAQAQARGDEATRQAQDAQAAIAVAARDYAAAVAKDPQSGAPEEIAHAPARLDALLDECETQRAAARKLLSAAQALARDMATLRKSADAGSASIDARRVRFAETDAAAREAGEARARAEQAAKGVAERIISLDRSLAPFLALAALTPADLDRDPAGARARLDALGQSYSGPARARRRGAEVGGARAGDRRARGARPGGRRTGDGGGRGSCGAARRAGAIAGGARGLARRRGDDGASRPDRSRAGGGAPGA